MAKVPVFAALTLFVLLVLCATHDVHWAKPQHLLEKYRSKAIPLPWRSALTGAMAD